jgi:hypothetical protein
MPPLRENDRTGRPRFDATRSTPPSPVTETRRFSRSEALALYERELAYFRADEPFLTVEKCAERCAKLSLLLTRARLD